MFMAVFLPDDCVLYKDSNIYSRGVGEDCG